MMKILRIIGKLLGALLIPVVIISTFASIFLLSFTTQLTNPDFYQRTFKEAGFFDQLPEIAAAQVRYSITSNPCLEEPDQCKEEGSAGEESQGGPPSYFQALTENDWETLLTELLPKNWLEEQIQDLVINSTDSIQSGNQELSLEISLLDLKDNLSGESGVEAISGLMKAQPDCSEDDLLEMTRILEGRQKPGKDFLSCNPGDDFLNKYAPQIEVLLRRSLRDVPDKIDFSQNLISGTPTVEIFRADVPLPVFLNFVRWVILISPLLILTLLLVIALLAAGSYWSLGKWWGYPLAISGLLVIALASFVSPAANFLLGRFLPESGVAGIHEKLIEAASGLGLQVMRSLFNQARNLGLILTGVGLTIILSTAVLGGSSFRSSTEEKDSTPDLTDTGLEEDAEGISELDQSEQEEDTQE